MSITFATPKELLEENRSNGAKTPEQHLEMLADNFVTAARAIDPSIINIWVGRDGVEFDRVFSIVIERKDSSWKGRS
jgi:hypothetical protein